MHWSVTIQRSASRSPMTNTYSGPRVHVAHRIAAPVLMPGDQRHGDLEGPCRPGTAGSAEHPPPVLRGGLGYGCRVHTRSSMDTGVAAQAAVGEGPGRV